MVDLTAEMEKLRASLGRLRGERARVLQFDRAETAPPRLLRRWVS